MKDNTIIFSVRNREPARIKTLVESARSFGISSPFLLLDFGSASQYADECRNMCSELDIQYVRTETEGLPWSRGQALNAGIRAARTKFVTTTDMDMLFENNPFPFIESHTDTIDVFYVMSYWLPKSGDKQHAECAGVGSRGGFQCIKKSIVEKLGGYDEKIRYWGLEDVDWTHRLEISGYTQKWVPDEFKMYHQWHPVAEGNALRPIIAKYDSMRSFYANMFQPVLRQDFGKLRTTKDRPILQLVRSDKLTGEREPHVITYNPEDFGSTLVPDSLVNSLGKNAFLELNIAPRTYSAPIKLKEHVASKLAKPYTLVTGTKIVPKVNENFDFFYASILPVLIQAGLKDYYISANLEKIYLLWD